MCSLWRRDYQFAPTALKQIDRGSPIRPSLLALAVALLGQIAEMASPEYSDVAETSVCCCPPAIGPWEPSC